MSMDEATAHEGSMYWLVQAEKLSEKLEKL